MRLRNAVVLTLVLVALAGAGCSRVAFVKTDPSRKGFTQVAEPVVVHDTDASRQRGAALNALDMSQQRLAEGDVAAAEQYAHKALKLDPQSADAYTLLAVIADRKGQSVDAGANYQRAATLAPQDGGALNNYGTWLCTNGHAAESLAWFDRALLDPSYPTPARSIARGATCDRRSNAIRRTRWRSKHWRAWRCARAVTWKRAHFPSVASLPRQPPRKRYYLRHRSKTNSATVPRQRDTFAA